MARRAFTAYAVVGALLASGFLVVPREGSGYDVWYLLVGLSAVVAIVVGVRINRPQAPGAWLLIAAGQLLFVAGDAVYLVYALLDQETPYPSVADPLYLAGYPVAAAGLLLMIRRRTPGRDWSRLIDAAIVTTGAACFSWIFLLEPYTSDTTLTMAQKLISSSYPVADVALLAVAARMVIGGGMRFPSFALLTGAVLLQLVGDCLYLLGTVQGWYADGSALDILWVAAYTCWGLSALHPSMRDLTARRAHDEPELTKQRVVLLGLATLMTVMLILGRTLLTASLDVFVMVTASIVLFGLVVARLAGVVTRHGRAKRREQRLRHAAAELVASQGRDDVYRTAVEAALALSEADGATTTRTTLSLGTPEQMEIVAAAGERTEGLVGRVSNVPQVVGEGLAEGRVATFTGPASVGANGLAAGEQLTVFPLRQQQQCRGALWVRTDGTLAPSQHHGLVTLVSQVALALESRDLTDDLLQQRSERTFRTLVQNSSDLIAVLEPDLTVRFATPSALAVLGLDADGLVGTSLASLLRPEAAADARALASGLGSEPSVRELELRRADGSWCTVETVWSDLSSDRDVGGIVVTARDVTDRKALEAQLTHQAFHDPLTGLANRLLFTDRVSHALERMHRSAEQIAVLFIDLDDFKTVNDSLGHAAGDTLLVGVAQRLERCLRGGDTCARLGGDEFGVLLEGVRPPEEAEEIAHRLVAALETPFEVGGSEVYARASVGVAIGATADGPSELLRNADVAMYRAKSDRGRSVEVFEAGMHEAAIRRLALRADLERAVAAGDFVVHYQPIVALETGRIAGLEALVRWQHPERGLLPPLTFVPLAEETGLIQQIGTYVLETACDTVGRWQRSLPRAERLRLSVNISGRQLDDPRFPAEVATALSRSGLRPDDLTLELTESVLMRDVDVAVGRLQRLKRLGVGIAIDDFGTGFSSLSYLHRFPVDTLKIAKQFVDHVGVGEQGRLVAAIVSLGASLHLETVAEGIVRAEQREGLRRLGCTFGQGYHFGAPASGTQTEDLLRRLLSAAA